MDINKIKGPEEDCFCYNKKQNECNGLKELICATKEKCSFYKHRADVDIAALEKSITIYNKTHCGKGDSNA